jgi:hypothetical protein
MATSITVITLTQTPLLVCGYDGSVSLNPSVVRLDFLSVKGFLIVGYVNETEKQDCRLSGLCFVPLYRGGKRYPHQSRALQAAEGHVEEERARRG